MSKYRNIKVHVPTPEISEAVQEKLFEDGCYWGLSIGKKADRARTPFLYVDEYGDIRWGLCESDFNSNTRKEVPYQSILDPLYDIKIAWANGEALQYRFKGDDDWIDWNTKASIHIGRGEEWRVKPKTKIIKQWERRYWDGKLANIVMTTDEKPDWSVLGCDWIGEPELKEYEVPND